MRAKPTIIVYHLKLLEFRGGNVHRQQISHLRGWTRLSRNTRSFKKRDIFTMRDTTIR